MTNKDYLSRAYRLQKAIEAKRRHLSYLENLSLRASQSLGEVVQSTPDPTRFSSLMAKIIDLKASVAKDEEALKLAREEISKAISAVQDMRYSLILELRYLLYLNWEDIILQTGYCRSYVYELHGRALRAVKQRE
jgi:hypothetical protein